MSNYRLFVNADSTVLVRFWPEGVVEVATRSERGATWGPPAILEEEIIPEPSASGTSEGPR